MTLGSIRIRILAGIGLLQLTVALVASLAVISYTRRELLAVLDTNLAGRATALLVLIQIPEERDKALIVRRELLVLPASDRFRVTDSKGATVADTSGWTPPALSPTTKSRSSFYLTVNGEAYRGLVIRDAPIVDSEEGEHAPPQNVTVTYAAPTAGMERRLRNVTRGTLVASLIMLTLSLLLAFLIIRIGLRPLRSLAARASLIDSETPHWLPPADAERVAELRPLSAALSQSINRLKAAFERERQMFSDAAHELKTAVAIVKSTLQVALQGSRVAADYRARIARALDDTDRLNALVTGMLQLASIESSDELPDAKTHVATAIASVIDQLSAIAQTHGVGLNYSARQADSVAIPEQEFMLLVTNLVENAIQHSASGKRVDILAEGAGDRVTLTIRDEGCGISEEALPHIFERFFRTDQSRSRETGGFGLGLAIVHALTVRHSGTVSANSRLGIGTTFVVNLPSSH